MQLFYNAELDRTTNSITFDKNESRHIGRVLRKKTGDILSITNGKSGLFKAKITIASDKKCMAEIIDYQTISKPWNYHLHLAIAPTKNNDRFEWFLEKATEIGIDEITPIICNNSERKTIKEDRFKKIIVAAAKQSLKYNFPILNPSVDFNTFIEQETIGLKCIAHCTEEEKTHLKSAINKQQKITILIGPEGDFSNLEIEKGKQKGFLSISLGESRLRTETAGIVAAHIVSLIHP